MTEAGVLTSRNAHTCPAPSFTNLTPTRSNVPAITAGLTPAAGAFCKDRHHDHCRTWKWLSKARKSTSLNPKPHEHVPRSPTPGASNQDQHAAAGCDVRCDSHPHHAGMAADGGFE